jgi:hypothetical protein
MKFLHFFLIICLFEFIGVHSVFSKEINKKEASYLNNPSKISAEDGFLFKEVTESSGINYQEFLLVMLGQILI